MMVKVIRSTKDIEKTPKMIILIGVIREIKMIKKCEKASKRSNVSEREKCIIVFLI